MYDARTNVWRVLLTVLFVLAVDTQAETLSLSRAQELAVNNDPEISRQAALASASRSRATSAGQLPDPMLRFGAMNFPTDSFDRGQEPMTQVQAGIQQMFPPGATRSYRSKEYKHAAGSMDATRDNRELQVRLETTRAWLARLQAEQRKQILVQELSAYERLTNLLTTRVETGSAPQSELIAVQLEHHRMQDRIAGESQHVDTAIGGLGRWVGWQRARLPLEDIPARDDVLQVTSVLETEELHQHPRYRAALERVAAASARVAQAQEAFGPSWGVDLSYGNRAGHNPNGSPRADFLSAMVMVSLPLFPEKRQDAMLAASQRELAATRDAAREILLQLQDRRARAIAALAGINQRIDGYEKRIVPDAVLQAESTLGAYRSGRGSFEALLRARLALMSARIDKLDLTFERHRTLATLSYLAGTTNARAIGSMETPDD